MSIASGFTHLKHLYFEQYDFGERGDLSRGRRDIFASQARNLAEAVPGLATITKFSALNQPYTIARITRRGNEQVTSVEVGNGSGMKIGYEDLAFPWIPHEMAQRSTDLQSKNSEFAYLELRTPYYHHIQELEIIATTSQSSQNVPVPSHELFRKGIAAR